jgi:ribosome modulation factor
MIDTPDPRSWWQKGYDSYPERHNYPEAATSDESEWLAGWYQAGRDKALAEVDPELDAESLAGRNSFAAGYGDDS